MRCNLILFLMCCPCLMRAAQFSGVVRAADQLVPGATVTARNGGAKVLTFTDESGHYALDLTPGTWEIEISMFEFAPATGKVTVSDTSVMRDWVLNMPKLAERGVVPAPAAATESTTVAKTTAAPAATPAAPATPRVPGAGARGNRGMRNPDGTFAGRGAGRGGPGQPQPGFQSAAVRATPEGEAAAADPQLQTADLGAENDDAMALNGSMSGGLEQSSDDEARRQRAMGGGRGGPGGPGGGGPGGPGGAVSAAQGMQNGMGLPPGMSASLDQ